MTRLIDADALRRAMYQKAMVEDSDMQKWDSGCWIRYKLFENVLDEQPTAPVIRCGSCRWWDSRDWKCDRLELSYGGRPDASNTDFCAWAERRQDD